MTSTITGLKAWLASRAMRLSNPKKLVLAVPIALTDDLAEMSGEADDMVCLEEYRFFDAIGLHYRDFSQVEDEEVIRPLNKCPAHRPEAAKQPMTNEPASGSYAGTKSAPCGKPRVQGA
jgi:putative phosphoribosyl transferase